MSQLFTWGGQSIGVSASASVLPMNTQDLSPLGWAGWISLQSKGLSRVFSITTVQKHQFFSTQLSSQSNSHIHKWPLDKPWQWPKCILSAGWVLKMCPYWEKGSLYAFISSILSSLFSLGFSPLPSPLLSCFLNNALYIKEKHLSRCFFWVTSCFYSHVWTHLWPRQLGCLMPFIKLPQDTQSLGKLQISRSYKRSIQISKFSIFSDYIGSSIIVGVRSVFWLEKGRWG